MLENISCCNISNCCAGAGAACADASDASADVADTAGTIGADACVTVPNTIVNDLPAVRIALIASVICLQDHSVICSPFNSRRIHPGFMHSPILDMVPTAAPVGSSLLAVLDLRVMPILGQSALHVYVYVFSAGTAGISGGDADTGGGVGVYTGCGARADAGAGPAVEVDKD